RSVRRDRRCSAVAPNARGKIGRGQPLRRFATLCRRGCDRLVEWLQRLLKRIEDAPPDLRIGGQPFRIRLNDMLALFDTGKRGIQVQPKPGSYAAEKGRTQRRSLRLVDNDDRRTEYGGLDRDEQRIARIAADHP